MPTRVYLSYAPADQAFAARLQDDLRAAGDEVVTSSPEFDTLDLSTSENLARLNQAMAGKDLLVVVLSPEALASMRVNRELYVASGRTTSGEMRLPVVIAARPVAAESLPALWSRARLLDASHDYAATLPLINKVVEGTENARPTGVAALLDEKGYSPRAIWGRFGYRGLIIVASTLIMILSFGMAWFSVGIACEDQGGCSLGPAVIAPGPNNVDGYYLAADKKVMVNTGTAPLDAPGVKVQNGYTANSGSLDPHVPLSVSAGTQTVVVNGHLTFTVTPTLIFSFSLLRFFLPIALIMLIVPVVVALAGLRPLIAKILVVLPIFAELVVLVIYIAAAPEAFHSSELIHFAPGPGGGTWLAFLFTIVAISTALSIPTKPPTQKV